MYEVACLTVVASLLIVWVEVEMRGRLGVRLVVGLTFLGFVGLMWFFASLRMAQLETQHQGLFREMGASLDAGDIDIDLFRRLSKPHRVWLEKGFAITDDFKGNTGLLLLSIVVHPDPG